MPEKKPDAPEAVDVKVAAKVNAVVEKGVADIVAKAEKMGATEPQLGWLRKQAALLFEGMERIGRGEHPAPPESSVATAPVNAAAVLERAPAAPLLQRALPGEFNRDVVEKAGHHDDARQFPRMVEVRTGDGAVIGARPNAYGRIALRALEQVDSVMRHEVFGEIPAIAYQLVMRRLAVLVDHDAIKVIQPPR